MRITGIQNFTLNSLNKCCEPKKSNSPMKNSLERTPAFDTVSFGKFGGKYGAFTKDQLFSPLLYATNDVECYNALRDAEYLSIEPTEETIHDPLRQIYEAKLVNYREFRSWASDEDVAYAEKIMRGRIEKFNRMNGYESGWEKHLDLHKPEDFIKAAELAKYLDRHGLFADSDEEDDSWFKNRPYNPYY